MTPISERWPAIYQAWRAGEAPETIARRHGIKLRTVKERCSWVDTHFPPASTARMRALAGALAVKALEAASADDFATAERLIRIITAIGRIQSQLEGKPMKPDQPDLSKPRSSKQGTPSRDAPEYARPGSAEHKQLVSEFEARLDALSRSIGMGPYPGGGAGGEETS